MAEQPSVSRPPAAPPAPGSDRAETDRAATARFLRFAALAIGLLMLAAAATLLLLRFPEIPLLIFAAVVGAILLDGMAGPLERHSPLPRAWAVVLVTTGLLAALGLMVWGFGPQLVEQTKRLAEGVGPSLESLLESANRNGWLGGGAPSGSESNGGAMLGVMERVASSARGIAGTLSSVLSGVAAVAVLAFFLAIQPRLYAHGGILLLPSERRDRMREVGHAVLRALRWWLIGRFTAMAAVGVLTFAGLAALQVPLALLLALMAGLLSFVPYLGPVLAGVPAVLVGFGDGGVETAAWVAGLYVAVQAIENNLVTPLVQFRAVSLPPAILVASQLAMGILFGLLGLLLAAPVVVTTIVLVQMLYVQDVLGEPVEVLAERNGRSRRRRRRPAEGVDPAMSSAPSER